MSQLDIAAIGNRIAAYRRRNRWSAQHLAENTDGAVSRATIANLESGRRTSIGLEQFLSLSLALRVPPVALLVDLDHPFTTSDVTFPGSAPAPLEPGAPIIALARWLNGETASTTTDAARHVAEVLALTTLYSALIDEDAAAEARARLNNRDASHSADVSSDRAQLQRQLGAIGVHIPSD